MKELREIDSIRGKEFGTFEDEIGYVNRYARVKSFIGYLFE